MKAKSSLEDLLGIISPSDPLQCTFLGSLEVRCALLSLSFHSDEIQQLKPHHFTPGLLHITRPQIDAILQCELLYNLLLPVLEVLPTSASKTHFIKDLSLAITAQPARSSNAFLQAKQST